MVRRVAVVTGASSGIGAETARELARRGWQVAVAGRNPERTHEVASRIGGEAFVADFDQLEQVRTLASDILNTMGQVDVLVNNAGGILTSRTISADGYELTLQRNVLGSVVLTEALLPELHERAGRIVHTSSLMHRVARLDTSDVNYERRPFRGGWPACAEAKLGVLLYAKHVAQRTGLESYPVHPGYVASNFGPDTPFSRKLLKLSRPLQISVPAGAAPLVHLVDTPELGVENGNYFDGLNPHATIHPAATNPALVQRYWDEVASRVG
jgi:NAD(P)-dependent dehydrogenase (short-subunit alcohol dehydrogenase family)